MDIDELIVYIRGLQELEPLHYKAKAKKAIENYAQRYMLAGVIRVVTNSNSRVNEHGATMTLFKYDDEYISKHEYLPILNKRREELNNG